MKNINFLVSSIILALLLNACGDSTNTNNTDGNKTDTNKTNLSKKLILTSNDIKPNGLIEHNLSGNGNGENPQLSWDNIPTNTKGYAFIMDDLSTKTAKEEAIVHWNFFTDKLTVKSIDRNSSSTKNISTNIREGTNYDYTKKYAPPYPPQGETHIYQFCIYAMNSITANINIETSFSNDGFKKKYQSNIIEESCFKASYKDTSLIEGN